MRVWIILTRSTNGEVGESFVIDTTDQDEAEFVKSQQERFGNQFVGAMEQKMILKTHDNKMAYHHTPKTGSRTVIGLMALAKNPRLIFDYPEFFGTHNREAVYPELREIVRSWQNTDLALCESEIRFCIIRDPVKRFVSGYTNRILYHHDIPPVSFDEFVIRFEGFMYSEILIREHFRPQVDFIGTDPGYYTHVFNTDESMEDLFELFEDVYKRPFPRLRLQQGGNDIGVKVTDQERAKIQGLFADDYRIWFDG